MDKADLPFLSASALGALIRNKEVSPVEATQAYLDRIAAIDGQLNSYITVCADDALQAARVAEQALTRHDAVGLLHGVPFAVKDQFWSAGVLTTAGSTLLADFVPPEDATVVARLKQAGAILLGKLNMSEFATGNSVHHPYGMPTIPGVSIAIRARPAAVPERRRRHFCAPRRLARTPVARFATRPITAVSSAFGPPGVW
jgi:Asp-tRNA(Asn)/Glu-tRNA(Gln) amidotransferase A subunit family amidase